MSLLELLDEPDCDDPLRSVVELLLDEELAGGGLAGDVLLDELLAPGEPL